MIGPEYNSKLNMIVAKRLSDIRMSTNLITNHVLELDKSEASTEKFKIIIIIIIIIIIMQK